MANNYLLKMATEMLRDAEKKADKYYWEYQNGGSSRTYNTYEKYDHLVTICRNAIENITEENDRQLRREHNYEEFLKKLPTHEKFTRDEVMDLIRQTLYM